jgi:hypothetical protein
VIHRRPAMRRKLNHAVLQPKTSLAYSQPCIFLTSSQLSTAQSMPLELRLHRKR